jgi:hypothetical protein
MSYNLVEWEQSNIGSIGGCVYAVQVDGMLYDKKDAKKETFLKIKSGSKPSGIQGA